MGAALGKDVRQHVCTTLPYLPLLLYTRFTAWVCELLALLEKREKEKIAAEFMLGMCFM